uniref:Uncharacterized protein n=1 Tax=Populus alba TaxID=43335 RepID=A0A4V6ACK7_POPAL|nr:hypothetical protein D5086_0000022240 [Populus alba]
MSAEVATIMEGWPVSLGHKRTKPTEVGHSGAKHFASSNVVHISDDRNVITDVEPPKRQYLTHSRVVAATNFGQQGRHDRVPKTLLVPACFLLALEVKICLLLLAIGVFASSLLDGGVVALLSVVQSC